MTVDPPRPHRRYAVATMTQIGWCHWDVYGDPHLADLDADPDPALIPAYIIDRAVEAL
ncbi:MAG: hypothetical protein ACRD6B_03820 [Bryobacteraceae bacterium]